MRIVVLSGLCAGSSYAYAINTVKMAAGFHEAGHHVTLICRQAEEPLSHSVEQIYGVPAFEWIAVPTLCRPGLLFGQVAGRIARRLNPDLVFVRDYSSASFCARWGIPTIMETHGHVGDRPFWLRQAARATRLPAFRAVITISPVLKEFYAEGLGMPAAKIAILPTGVNVTAFERPPERPYTPIASRRPRATFVGHLYDYKGVPTILGAAALAPEIEFNLVGGADADLATTRERVATQALDNVVVHGRKMQTELPEFLWESDVLLLPPSANHPSARWTSPVKLGEYLAAGTPIVATDIPALRTWLTDDDVAFIAPDNPQSMVDGIRALLANPGRAQTLSARGPHLARKWSYENRARHIIELGEGRAFPVSLGPQAASPSLFPFP